MALSEFVDPQLALVLGDVPSRDDLFAKISAAACALHPEISTQQLVDRLIEREEQVATSTPEGVAFPHALMPEIGRTLVGLARVDGGVDFGQSAHPRSDLVFFMLASPGRPWEHLRLLARLARLVHEETSRRRLREAPTAEALFEVLLEEDRSHE